MLVCQKCLIEYEEGRRFCRNCGSPLQLSMSNNPKALAAKEVYAGKLANDPSNVALLLEYGELLFSAGAMADAAKELEKALSLEKNNLKALDLLSSIYVSLNKPSFSDEYLKKIIASPHREAEHFERLARIQFQMLKQEAKAIETLADGLGLYPNNLELLRLQFEYLRKSKQYTALLKTGHHILTDSPNEPDVLRAMADGALELGDRAAAFSFFHRLITVSPVDARAVFYSELQELEQIEPDDAGKITSIYESIKNIEEGQLHEKEWILHRFCIALCRVALDQSEMEDRKVLLSYLKRDIPATWATIIRSGFFRVVDREFGTSAVASLEESLEEMAGTASRPQARELVACMLYYIGTVAEKRNNLAKARYLYGLASSIVPKDTLYKERYAEVTKRIGKKRRRIVFAMAGGIALLCCLAVALFLSRGRMQLAIEPPGAVTIYRANKIVSQSPEGESFLTDFMWTGSYKVIATKPGYRIEKEIHIGFGRKTLIDSLVLIPNYGILVVNSDPPGAWVWVDGEVEGVTPFRSDSLLAKQVKVGLEKERYLYWERDIAITQGIISDMGLISLELTPAERLRLAREETARGDSIERERELQEIEEQKKRDDARAKAETQRSAQVLLGRWYFDKPPCNAPKNYAANTGAYIEFETITPAGSLAGAFVRPGENNRRTPFQGTLRGTSFELIMTDGGVGRSWKGTIDLEAKTLSGSARDIQGPWVLRGGWKARKR